MAYTLTQLQTFFTNANAGTAPTAAQLTGLQGIANQNATGALSDAQALQSAIDMGSDVTTAVSISTYQFFLGFAPSVAGLKALNAAYTGSGAQAGLNGENRFIAQSVALALQNAGAKTAFSAAYGSMSYADATAAMYNVIIGNTAAAAAGVNVANAVAFLSSAASIAYYEAFVKANVPGLAAADVSLAVKAALVGEIIYQATIFNNGAGLGSYATASNNLVKDLADDGALTADNANGIALFDNYGVSPVAQTLTLTTGADTLNGAAGADTFVATNTTLSAADSLTGGAGVDTLNYASTGAAAVNQAGFKAAGIETFNITSDATGGTTFDMSGVTGATRVVNDDSSFDLTVTGLNELATVVVRNTSQSTATVNTTVNYNAAATAGATTTQNLILENVFDPAQAAGTASKSAVTVNGVEIFNVTGSGANNNALTALASNTLTTVNIDGSKGVKIDALTFSGTTGTVDGSKNTGGINVTLTNSGAVDAVVTGGTGNDRADFSAGFAAKDSFTGGAGTDTLVLSNTVATGAVGGTLSGVEVLEISAGGTGTVDLSKFAGVTEVVYTSSHVGSNGNSLAGATVVSKAGATSIVTADVGAVAQNLTVSVATDGAADATTINLNKVATGDAIGTLTATDIETLTVNIADDAAVLGTGTLTVASIAGNKLATVNVTSNADVTITGAVGGSALKSFDISAATGKATLTGGITTALTGATIKLGAGDDQVNVNATTGTATGGDTITLGAGKDVVTYTTLAQSGDKTVDTITDFTSGTDKLDLIGLGLNTSSLYLGDRASFGLAQGALTGAQGQAVFQADTSTLWIDINGDKQLDGSDFRIVLSGNKTVTAADLSLGSGASIALSAPNSVVNLTTNTNASNKSTNENDSISSTIANLVGATVDGLIGTDTLTVTDAGTVTVANTITNVETLVLANGTNTVTLNATSFKSVTGGTGADSLALTNLAAGGAVALGAGADAITAATEALIEGASSTFNGGADADTLTFANGLNTANLDLSSVSAFETINLGTVAGATTVTAGKFAAGVTTLVGDTTNANITVNMTAAQLDALTTITSAAAGNAFAIATSDTGAVTVNLADTTFTTLANVDSFNFSASGANKVTVTIDENIASMTAGTATTDQVNVTADLTAVTLNTTGFEVINVTAVQAGLTVSNSVTKVIANLGGTFNLGTGGDTIETSGAAAFTVVGNTGNDVITHSGTATLTYTATGNGDDTATLSSSGGITYNGGTGVDKITSTGTGVVNFTGGDGLDVVTLSTGASADLIHFDGAGVGVVAAANRDTITNFNVGADKLVLDIDQTTAGTAAAANAVIQAVNAAGAVTFNNTVDVVSLAFEMGGTTAVLDGVLDGTALLANLGAVTVVANDKGYIVAYDAGNAYLYAYTDGGNTSLAAGEIALIGVINGVAVGSLGAGQLLMA